MEPTPITDDTSEHALDPDFLPRSSTATAPTTLAKKETRAVFRVKLLLLLLIFGCAAVAAWGTREYSNRNETKQFEEKFQDDAHKIVEAIGRNVQQTLEVMDALASLVVAEAQDKNETWPFVTTNHFGLHAAKLLSVNKPLMLAILPIVTNETRVVWEEYSSPAQPQLDQWFLEVVEIQQTDKNYHGPSLEELIPYQWAPIHDDYDILPYNHTLMLPQWMVYPMATTSEYGYAANWEWHTTSLAVGDLDNAIALEQRAPVIGEPYLLPSDDPQEMELLQIWADYYLDYLEEGEDPMEPISDIFYPILNQVDSVHSATAQADPNVELVGLVVAPQYWRTFIRDILPTGSNGIDVVFHPECAQNFTYRLEGPRETYKGSGDLHCTKYDHLGVHGTLRGLNEHLAASSKYNGAPISDYCPINVHVYPSDTMKDQFTTNTGVIFAVAALAIFLGTSLFFLLYDVLVERRQRVVMRTALKSTAVVSSLFPEKVRDKIYSEAAPEGPKKKSSLLSNVAPDSITSSPPIADLYPETTIMFADLKGFTKWSSTRSPTEVFTLLESIYAAFDEIAEKRRVFKIETIGDCYVAVCGLPEPNQRHASTMARFASDCIAKMDAVTKILAEKLGDDTSTLQLRVGLNSGPTTAGVLRGAKSRFQLFGDTVNTAARMEANSEGGRIMVSQSTADQLVAADKEEWLTSREDLVEAKGKGSMQCYWCLPPRKSQKSSMHTSTNSVGSEVSTDLDESGNIGRYFPELLGVGAEKETMDVEVCQDIEV